VKLFELIKRYTKTLSALVRFSNRQKRPLVKLKYLLLSMLFLVLEGADTSNKSAERQSVEDIYPVF